MMLGISAFFTRTYLKRSIASNVQLNENIDKKVIVISTDSNFEKKMNKEVMNRPLSIYSWPGA